MRMIQQLDRLLNAKRLAYAWIAGGVLWFGWLISILLGPGNRDLHGQLIGVDFLAFYTGGEILLQDESANLYDLAFQQSMQQELIGGDWPDLEAFVNPPFYAWLAVPFAKVPYLLSFGLWTLLGLVGLWISLRLLGLKDPGIPFLWALSWYPVFAAISFGQNSLLSVFLFCLAFWLWRKNRLWTAGLVSSLLLFKPQWLIGLGILWLLDWRRSRAALLGLTLGGVILALLSIWQLPEASSAYLDLSRNVLPQWQTQPGYQLFHLHTVRGFWLLLLSNHRRLADLLSLLLMISGLVSFVLFWVRYRNQQVLLFAGMICLTLWMNPHAMIYDWAVLLIPAVLLWRQMPHFRGEWKVLYASIWLVTFCSSLLTWAQLQFLPFAVQISVPAYLIVILLSYRFLRSPPQPDLVSPQATEAGSEVRFQPP
jgi:alpha-1,2-mannosyltransferase